MNLTELARVIDLFALAFVFGGTAWFFFVQSPVLMKKMGREQFVPVQMRLTIVLFKALTVALVVMFVASAGHSPFSSYTTVAAGVALLAVLGNKFLVIPRALRAGGQSIQNIKGKDSEGSTAGFAAEGVGDGTKSLHRLVVLFVVLMLAGVIVHGTGLLGTRA